MNTISVLMAVYDSEKPEYLDRALKSVWDDQTFKPTEIILVKDGPLNTGLEKIIKNWQERLESIMVILNNDVNLGLTKSLNKGIAVAKGEFLARMDSDDISLPDRFKIQVEFLNLNQDIDVVGGALQEFSSSQGDMRKRLYPATAKEILKYICKASPLAHPTVMMRRRIFDNGLQYNEKYRTSQDVALWFELLSHGYHISNISDIVLRFRREEDGYKRRSRKKAKSEFDIYCSGIYQLYGWCTWRYIYPIARFLFRMMPIGVVRTIYCSSVRTFFLHNSKG